VFVASRDDDADYKNAVAQNASLHIVFSQDPPSPSNTGDQFCLFKLLRPSSVSASLRTLYSIEQPQCSCALIKTSPHSQSPPVTICMMLGCSAETPAALSPSCPDLMRLSPMKTLSQTSLISLALQNLSAFNVRRRTMDQTMYPRLGIASCVPNSQARISDMKRGRKTGNMPESCHARPFIVLCPSYPQSVVLFPLIRTRNAAKVIPVIIS
jgi:hypothetical protein